MELWKKRLPGILLCAGIALPCWLLGKQFPLIGGPVFGILVGMMITLLLTDKEKVSVGIAYTSKKILQYAVILLGFGLNLSEIAKVGAQSLPIIISTISMSLIIAYILYKTMRMPKNIATLIGVGSSICGGSAIAATAPVIGANDEEIAQSISVIFLFNVIAALIFPTLGTALGMTNEGFGLFAGTAVNDTSSVTAAASAWDGMHPGANTLELATVVKLTRTLAIIPITLVLAIWTASRSRKEGLAAGTEAEGSGRRKGQESDKATGDFSLKKIFPYFILLFVFASVITTVCSLGGIDIGIFRPLKELSKFFIVMAMSAIGLNTNIVKLVTTGGKPIFMGLCCWVGIAATSLGVQHLIGIF